MRAAEKVIELAVRKRGFRQEGVDTGTRDQGQTSPHPRTREEFD